MGASLAMSSGRYGIITGRINRSNADPLVLVSFPYASPEGYTMEYEGEDGEMFHTANSKGTVDERGLVFYVFDRVYIKNLLPISVAGTDSSCPYEKPWLI